MLVIEAIVNGLDYLRLLLAVRTAVAMGTETATGILLEMNLPDVRYSCFPGHLHLVPLRALLHGVITVLHADNRLGTSSG